MRKYWGRERERLEPGFSDAQAPQHFLNFLPLPQGHGSFLPIFCLVIGAVVSRIVAAMFDIWVFWRKTLPTELTLRDTETVSALLFACSRSSAASLLRPCSSQASASRSAMSARSLTSAMESPSRRICSQRLQSRRSVHVNR